MTDPPMSMARIGEPSRAESTNRTWHHRAIDETVALVSAAAEAGVSTIQLRWKNVDAGYLFDLVREAARALSTGSNGATSGAHPLPQLIVNDRIDVFVAAREAGIHVDGVHVGQTDLPARSTRVLVGDSAQIGWSASTPSELDDARALGTVIDCLGVAVVRSTATKTDAPDALGVSGIDEIARSISLPVIAIGGIIRDDIPAIAASQIHSAAVVSAIVAAEDPGEAAADLVTLWNSAKEQL
ncbi:MAG: thiamine phosphate synthase [Actinomycetaceae bacterium]|nr:thiamine phosphate synthase [Actinomycetaceae bacterium]